MFDAKTRHAARIAAVAVGGVLAALAVPGGASAQIYKAYDNGVLAYSTDDGAIRTIFQNGTNDAIVATAWDPLGVKGTVGEWSADGTRLLLSDQSQDLVDVNPWTKTQIRKVDLPFAVDRPSMSPDGTAYAFGSTGNGANIYNTADESTSQVFPGASDGTAWSNEDQLIATRDGDSILRFPQPVATNHATGNTVASGDPFYPLHATISRDGTKVAYTALGINENGPSDDVFLANADGSNDPGVRVEGNTDGSQDQLATISPDGKKIAFVSNRDGDGTWSIYIRDLDAGTTTVVPNTKLVSGRSFRGLSWQPATIPHLAEGKITTATEVGSTLRLDDLYDLPTAPIITTWQWQTCTDVDQYDLNGTCTDLPGETGAGYPLTASDVGKRFRVIRTVTNGAGTDTRATLITEAVVEPDTTPPGVPTITTKPSTRSNATAATFAWTGAEAGGSYQCSLDNGAFTACTSGAAFPVSGDSSHSFRVRQVDASNNLGDPAEYTWTLDATNPSPVTIVSKPPARTQSTSATITFTGDEVGGTFECRLGADGANWVACASPATLAGLTEGDKRLSFRQRDQAGNVSAPEIVTWTVDTTAPAAPTITTKPSAPTKATAPTFAWTGAEADGTYECSLDGAAFTACTSGDAVPVTGDDSHSFRVRQVDAAGNTGTEAEHTWTLDTTGPAAPTLTTKPDSRSSATTPTFAWTGAEADGTYECSLDGGPFTTCTSGTAFPVSGESEHTFRIRQVDAAGNEGAAAEHTWTLDTTAPGTPTVTGKPAARVATRDATFTFTGDEAGGRFECRDGSDAQAWTPCGSPVTLAGRQDGSNRFSIRQVDAAGNAGTPEVVTWTVDMTAPGAPMIIGSHDDVYSLTTEYQFVGESGATFECRLDTGAWSACTSPTVLSGYGTGTHTFSVRQVDEAGNTSPAADDSFTAHLDGPAKPSLGQPLPPKTTKETAATFDVTVGPDTVSLECRLDDGAWTPCASPWKVENLRDGEHTLQVRGRDTHGVPGAATTHTWTVDTAKPATPALLTPPPSETTSGSIDVRVDGLEAGATIECAVDAGAWAPCSAPLKLDGFAPGKHTVKLRQTDAAGNVSDEASFAWTVVVQAPVTTPTPTPQAPAPAQPKLTALIGGAGTGTKSAATITVKQDGVGVGCSITGTVLTSCKVDLYTAAKATASAAHAAAAKPVLIGTGTYRNADGAKKLEVDVALNATGRALMRKSPRGLKVSVKITGTPVKGEKLEATGVATLVRQRVTATIGGFAVNRATLTTAAKRQLNQLAKQVKATAVAIRVVGNTDASTDDAAYLKRLGERRAEVVAAYLRARGVKAKATLVSAGAGQPKASNATAAGRAKNRRVELRIDR